jgi:predicted transcriptional regulator
MRRTDADIIVLPAVAVDGPTGRELAEVAAYTDQTRSACIRDAVQEYLHRTARPVLVDEDDLDARIALG